MMNVTSPTTTKTMDEESTSTSTPANMDASTSFLSTSHLSSNSSNSNSLSIPSPTNSVSSYADTRIVRFDNECVLIPELQRIQKNGLFKKPMLITKSYSYALPPLWKRRNNNGSGSGEEGDLEPRSPSSSTASPELVFKVPVPSFMTKSPRSPVSPSMSPLPPCLVRRVPSDSYSPQSPPPPPQRRIQRRSSLPLPLDVVSHAHLHAHAHAHAQSHSHSSTTTASSFGFNPNKSPKIDSKMEKDVNIPETVPLRPCCPQCYPATENSIKDIIEGKQDEWKEHWSRGAKKRRSASLDETSSIGYGGLPFGASRSTGDASYNDNNGIKATFGDGEEESVGSDVCLDEPGSTDSARPGSSGSGSGFAAVSLNTPGRHERAVVSSRANSIHVDEVDKRRRLSALTEVSREGSRDNSRSGSRAGSRTGSRENLLEYNRVWEMQNGEKKDEEATTSTMTSNATITNSSNTTTKSLPPLSPIKTHIPPHLSSSKYSPSSSPTSTTSFSSTSRYYKSSHHSNNVPIRRLPTEDEDEDQLFPLPSPRRTPNASPSGSPLGSTRGSPAASPVPSPCASSSQINLVSSSNTKSGGGRLANLPAASASRESLAKVISDVMEKEKEGEGILGQSLSRKDRGDSGIGLGLPSGSGSGIGTGISVGTGRCEKGLLTPETPSNGSGMPMSMSPPSGTGRASPAPRSPSPLRHSHSHEGGESEEGRGEYGGSVESGVESTDSGEGKVPSISTVNGIKEKKESTPPSIPSSTIDSNQGTKPIPIPFPTPHSHSSNSDSPVENSGTNPNHPNPSSSPLTSFRKLKLFNRGGGHPQQSSGSENGVVEEEEQDENGITQSTPTKSLSSPTVTPKRRPSLQNAVAGVLRGVSSMGSSMSIGGVNSLGSTGGA
ncbi:hypothetical protein K435DRAFT_315385 [Dendrothele bispora CBS 962.96]|uniref:Uncharacterized protein n=1 Tax=Dendrothele bispora (strain CBS 962.96) TaxID=1314807 RepID=A0A4S8LH42_DENBC|nr:hypothetical protein K435DRAFT_315385 [Dendrothele bispora CBS 962.96]